MVQKLDEKTEGEVKEKVRSRMELLEDRVTMIELLASERLDTLERSLGELKDVVKLLIVAQSAPVVAAVTKGKAKFGGNGGAKQVRDKETGVVYESLSKCGKALAHLVNGSPLDHFVWYELHKQFPDRFEIL